MRSIKKFFKKILGRFIFSFDELFIVLVEIEGIINFRFFMYVYDDNELIFFFLIFFDLIYGRWIILILNVIYYEVVSIN